MTSKLDDGQEESLEEAIAALQPFYDPGDDGDAVRIALNAIAGLLGERSDIPVPADDGLNAVLQKLTADVELRAFVRQLYKAAGRGAYGDGLSKKDANKINDIVQDVIDPLVELVRQRRRKRRQSARVGPTRRGKI